MYFSKANNTLALFLNINTLSISFRHAAGRVWSWRCAGERMHLYLVTSLMNYTTSSNTCSRQTPETDPLYKPSSTLTVCPDCCINTWHQRYPSKSCECLIQTPGIRSDVCRNVIFIHRAKSWWKNKSAVGTKRRERMLPCCWDRRV